MSITEAERSLFIRALQSWGHESQIKMCVEECAELIVAIQQHYRGRNTTRDLCSEIADVMIMCKQMAIMVDEDLVREEMELKLNRLEKRLP